MTAKHAWVVGASVVTALVGWSVGARAEDCGNVSESGICQDPKTLVYCAKGELETMTCPEGEICVAHEFFDGGFGCVKTRYAGCGDITEAGRCVGDSLVLYCENDRVTERACDDGWTCGLVPADRAGQSDYYDCVPDATGPSSPSDSGEDAGSTPVSDTDESDATEPDPGFSTDTIAAPSIVRGGAGAASEYSAGGGAACNGGGFGDLALAAAVASALYALAQAAIRASRRRTARSR
ncbi:MAG: hypothetical protein U1F43_08260 [Myxococcota bacterium]